MKTFEKIIKIRFDSGLNQSEFAKKLNIDRAAVFRWEKGETKPSKPTLLNICNTFNVNPVWLIDENNSVDPYIAINNDVLCTLKNKYDLSGSDIDFLKSYLSANQEKRQAINNVVKF